MTNGWQTVPLDEFLAQRKEFFTINDFTRYKRARVQLHGRGIVLRDDVEGVEVKTKEQQAARTGEFLVAEIDAKLGGFGIVPFELDGAIVSSHYFLFEINEQKCLRQWLDWFIRSGMLEEQVIARGSTNYSAIRPSHVLKFEIPLPPLAEQRRIVARIEALAARVAEAQRLRGEASEEAKVILNSASADCFKEIKNWRKLGDDLFDLIYRYPTFYNITFTESGVGLLKISNLTQEDWKINFESKKEFIDDETSKQFPQTILESGDLLMAVRGATIGKTAYVTDEYAGFNINANLLRLKPNRKILNGKFFWYFMKSSIGQNQFQLLVTSTAKQTITVPKLKSIQVPIPSLEEQQRLVTYLDGLQTQVSKLRAAQGETARELNALMPSVLDRAFKGEM